MKNTQTQFDSCKKTKAETRSQNPTTSQAQWKTPKRRENFRQV